MDLRILGPLEVREGGRSLPLGGAKQRALLAILSINAGEVVSVDRLVDLLWPNEPPDTARNVIQVYVSQLRKVLRGASSATGRATLSTKTPGYVLELDPETLDRDRFERRALAGRAALDEQRAHDAAELLDEALAEFRGDPLSDFTYDGFAEAEIQRLQEHRLVALEDVFDAQLVHNSGSSLIPDLESLVTDHPYRERLRRQLMLALYRSGRQADALTVYRDGSRALAEELGIDPGPELQHLHEAVLRQDASLMPLPTPETRAQRQPRKLEPSTNERVMVTALCAQWPAVGGPSRGAAEQLIEAQGGLLLPGTDEQVIAILGFPHVSDDHAEQAALTALALAAQGAGVGLATAKVATTSLADPSGDLDVVATATSLCASPEVVRVDPVAGRRLRQQFVIDEVAGTLAIAPNDLVGADVPSSPLVGRDREISRLTRCVTNLMSGRGQVLLIDGATGLGKSRLLTELRLLAPDTHWIGASCTTSTALALRPPLVLALHQLLDDQSGGSVTLPAAADAALRQLTTTTSGGAPFQQQLESLIESLATDAPVVVAVDDTHLIDPATARTLEALLPLVDRFPLCLALTLSTGEPGSWASLVAAVSTTMRHRLTQLELEPLTADQTAELADALSPTGSVDPASRADVVERSAGNPLFVEQLVMSISEVDEPQPRQGWTLALTTVGALLPPLLEDVLAARMQRLEPDARLLAQVAATLGEASSAADLQQIAQVSDPVHGLDELLRAEILVEKGRFPDITYQFHHRLLQDAALSTLTPTRARELYRQSANLVEERDPANAERIAFLRYRAHQWQQSAEQLDKAAARLADVDPERSAGLREIADRARSHEN